MYGNSIPNRKSRMKPYDKPQHLMYGNLLRNIFLFCSKSDKPQHLMYGNDIEKAKRYFKNHMINLNI